MEVWSSGSEWERVEATLKHLKLCALKRSDSPIVFQKMDGFHLLQGNAPILSLPLMLTFANFCHLPGTAMHANLQEGGNPRSAMTGIAAAREAACDSNKGNANSAHKAI